MSSPLSLDELWQSAAVSRQLFAPPRLIGLPQPAQRYLRHAIAAGTLLASAVRLKMHGEIKLKGWCPFTAEQVICRDRGMIWRATARMYGMPIRGSDRLLDGQGAMLWKLFGIVPVVNASGPDITRSGAGRMNIESACWLPSVLCDDGDGDVSWTASDASRLQVGLTAQRETTHIDLLIDGNAGLHSICAPRWGNPGNSPFHYEQFGAKVEGEGIFGGYTVPTRLRVGWYFGTDRFDPEGEFFRVTIDDAIYR